LILFSAPSSTRGNHDQLAAILRKHRFDYLCKPAGLLCFAVVLDDAGFLQCSEEAIMTDLEKQTELALIVDLIKQSQAAQYLQTVEPGLIIDTKA
jgi:hypothetical protein